ncbi:MAG: hypothetical protein ACOZQL_04450 [Myxococcota bacterium]
MRSSLVVLCLLSASACCPTPSPTCATGGTATLVISSTGLPDGVTGLITATGATVQTVTSSRTLAVGSGPWSVTAERTTIADPLVRTVYVPTVSPASFCLAPGGTQDVIVTWSPVATSGALWGINGTTADQFLGFRSAHLRTSTASQPADVKKAGAFGQDLAFDKDGNVWVVGPTTTDAVLNRFPSSAFAASGAATPDRALGLAGPACGPLVTALAFDARGNLWLSSPCRDAVLRVDAASLEAASGTVTPSLTLPVGDPNGLAFDRAGNLWVVSRMDSRVWRYDAALLGGSAAPAPTLKLGGRASDDPMDASLLAPSWLAFDSRGDLWANDFGGNKFFRIAAADLRASGTSDVNPQVRLTLGVTALLEGFAFDGEGGLWSAGRQGHLVRLAPAQLDVDSGPGMPTLPAIDVASPDVGYLSNLAFYPAPAGLPLYHALP